MLVMRLMLCEMYTIIRDNKHKCLDRADKDTKALPHHK